MNLWDMHAYVFTIRDGYDAPLFERTFPAACIDDALRWIEKSPHRGFISINCLPSGYWR